MDRLDAYAEYEGLWATAAAATEEERSTWQELIATLPATSDAVHELCGYRVWTAKDDDSWQEETFSPWESPAWALHTVDGMPPDAKVLKAYTKDKRKAARREAKARKRAERKDQSYMNPRFHPLAVLQVLRPLSEPDVVIEGEADARFFGFHADFAAEETVRGVQTTVGVSREGRLESVDQRSSEPFSGGTGVRIERIHTRMIFGHEPLGLPSVRYYEMAFDAKALGILKVRNRTTRWYGDTRCSEGA